MSTQLNSFSGGVADYRFLADHYFAIFVTVLIVSAVIFIRFNYLTGILSLALICYAFYEAFRVFSLKYSITTSEVYGDSKYFDIIRNTVIFDVVGLISLGILSLLLICYIFIQFRGVVDCTRKPSNSIISDVK